LTSARNPASGRAPEWGGDARGQAAVRADPNSQDRLGHEQIEQPPQPAHQDSDRPRRPELSSAHHREVAAQKPATQERWLAAAAREGWSHQELRAVLRAVPTLLEALRRAWARAIAEERGAFRAEVAGPRGCWVRLVLPAPCPECVATSTGSGAAGPTRVTPGRAIACAVTDR
jgi:hypothetical protein